MKNKGALVGLAVISVLGMGVGVYLLLRKDNGAGGPTVSYAPTTSSPTTPGITTSGPTTSGNTQLLETNTGGQTLSTIPPVVEEQIATTGENAIMFEPVKEDIMNDIIEEPYVRGDALYGGTISLEQGERLFDIGHRLHLSI
jgi:hypothetical protein